MRHLVLVISAPAFTSLLASFFVLLGHGPSTASAYVCGPTGSSPETNSKLQIFVSGERVDETQWAFKITPNPFTLGGSLRLVDNQSIDLNRSLNDMLLEDVCTTVTGETYTVTLDTATPPACPLVTNTLTRSAPEPTPALSDPQTAAFYFVAKCIPPTPIPSPTPPATPIPSPTPPGIPATPTPVVPITYAMDLIVSPSQLACRSTALVTVTLRGELDADVILTTSLGVITPVVGRASNGLLIARLDLQGVYSPVTNLVIARTVHASGAAPFTVTPCPDPATPTIPPPPVYYP